MKIIEGQLRGLIVNYKEQKGTRVTSEKVRKAVFDMLKNIIDIEGIRVADIFCGSGMYGIESISRGAESCTFVDEDRRIISMLKDNLKKLGIKGYNIENKRFESFIKNYSSTREYDINGGFNLIFVDPPYYQFDFSKLNDIYSILEDEGVFVLECSRRTKIGEFKGLELLVEKQYGDTSIRVYRKSI